MTDPSPESKFVNQIKQTLDDSVEHLDPGIQSRLTRARYQALESGRRRRSLLSMQRIMVAAAAILVLVFGAIMNLHEPAAPRFYSEIEDIEILATGDNPDFYVELDFYTWLAEEIEDAG